MCSFGQVQELLVVSFKYFDCVGCFKDLDELVNYVILSISEDEVCQCWELYGLEGVVCCVDLQLCVVGFDFLLLQSMVKDGFGIIMLLEIVCVEVVCNGELEVVLLDWLLLQGICYVVFVLCCGLLLVVCVFIDFFVEYLLFQFEVLCLDCGGVCECVKEKIKVSVLGVLVVDVG